MVQVSDEELISGFSDFDITVSDDDLLDKLKHFCSIYQVDATDMVTQWVAYSHNKGNCPMNASSLDALERESLVKEDRKTSRAANRKKGRDIRQIENTAPVASIDDDTAQQLLGAYSTPNNKKHVKRVHTPEDHSNKRLMNLGGTASSVHLFSPASFSPNRGTPSQEYGKRQNSGEVVCSFQVDKSHDWSSMQKDRHTPLVHYTQPTSDQFKYMFQKLGNQAYALNDQIEYMMDYLRSEHIINDVCHVALPAQEPVTIVGRILCDSNGKLNAKSLMIEGSRETSAGKQIHVDLTAVSQYSLFPGQVVAMEGTNSSGRAFVASKVHEGVPRALPKERPDLSEGGFSMVVAAGPFTTSDSLSYEPLDDLTKYLIKNPPDICVLMGPFVDVKHAEIDKMTQTFDNFFMANVSKLSEYIKKLPTELVIVPSHRDIHHHYVYPQPPFNINGAKMEKVHFVPDPCSLSVCGVHIAMTSTDVLLHIGREEISSGAGSDRLGRLVQHLLTQHSFYPLYPPDDELNMDYELLEENNTLPQTPHLIFVPSDLRYFTKDIKGTCCVNPGRLTKGKVGGTFARVTLNGSSNENGLKISAEVVRI